MVLAWNYHGTIMELAWYYYGTMMVLALYYHGIIIMLKVLSGCHDILLLCKTCKINNKQQKPKQTLMNFAGELWHSEDDQKSVLHPPLPPPRLWPPHEVDIILEYWGHLPTSKGAWQSVLTKLWQYNFAFVLQTYTETKWESMHHFLVSLKTCLGSWRKCSHGLPPHVIVCIVIRVVLTYWPPAMQQCEQDPLQPTTT